MFPQLALKGVCRRQERLQCQDRASRTASGGLVGNGTSNGGRVVVVNDDGRPVVMVVLVVERVVAVVASMMVMVMVAMGSIISSGSSAAAGQASKAAVQVVIGAVGRRQIGQKTVRDSEKRKYTREMVLGLIMHHL